MAEPEGWGGVQEKETRGVLEKQKRKRGSGGGAGADQSAGRELRCEKEKNKRNLVLGNRKRSSRWKPGLKASDAEVKTRWWGKEREKKTTGGAQGGNR